MEKKRYSHVLWDWNGTLLNDVDWCMKQINRMLAKRNKRILENISEYHAVFCFPIIDYYRNVGFDFTKEPFEALAQEYITMYHGEDSDSVSLHSNTEYVLKTIQNLRISQSILSASAQSNLEMQLKPFNIRHYFGEILGISDIYAKSKLEIGLDYLSRNNVQGAILIGDTTHDFEVSQVMGIECVLVAHGHQSKEKLMKCNVHVFDNLNEVLSFLVG